MKQLAIFFLLISLAAGAFDCKASPYQLGLTCYYQYFSTVGNNFNCTTTFATSANNYLLSMEMTNIGENDMVSVSWGNSTVSSSGTLFSVQEPSLTDVTISITTGNSSMAGIFFICPTDVSASVPTEQVNISYNQEAFVLQQFSAAASGPTANFKAPRKWEIRTDTQVAVIAAADTTTQQMNCPVDSCMQLIWIYEGIGENARFIGTAADFQNKLYLSQNTTMTLYFVTMDMGTDYMAVIANEAKNLERCSAFDAVFYSTLNNLYSNTLNVTTAYGGACLTVLNHCVNGALCDGVVLNNALQHGNSDFYAYAGAPHPNPIMKRLGLENYSNQNIVNDFPQNFAGNARTFYVADGSAALNFGNPNLINNAPYIGRQGFLMTNFYPFYSNNQYGGKLDLVRVNFPYEITVKVNTTYAPPSSDAYLAVYKDGNTVERMAFDATTNVGKPIVVHVEANSSCSVDLWGGKLPNQGTNVFFFIESEATTTTRGPTTTTTSKPNTTSTIPSTTVTKPTTTMPLPTTTVSFTATRKPTAPTTTPKSTGGLYFLMVTVFSIVYALL